MHSHFFLVLLLLHLVRRYFLLDFSTDLVVCFQFFLPLLFDLLDGPCDALHALLEVSCQCLALLSLLVEHLLVLEVHVVVLVEDGGAHELQSLPYFDAVVEGLLNVVPLPHALQLLLLDSRVLLDGLPRRVIHDFDQSVGKRLEPFGVRGKGGVASIKVLPLVLVPLQLLVYFLLLFLLEFLFEFLLLLREIWFGCQHLLVLFEGVDDLLIHLLLADPVLFCPLLRGLRRAISHWLLLLLTFFTCMCVWCLLLLALLLLLLILFLVFRLSLLLLLRLCLVFRFWPFFSLRLVLRLLLLFLVLLVFAHLLFD